MTDMDVGVVAPILWRFVHSFSRAQGQIQEPQDEGGLDEEVHANARIDDIGAARGGSAAGAAALEDAGPAPRS